MPEEPYYSEGNDMASDGTPGQIPVASLVQGSRAVTSVGVKSPSGNYLPQGGKQAVAQAVAVPTESTTNSKSVVPQAADSSSLVQHLNKVLNDSGRPDQFRLDPSSDGKLIQQINPATGDVIGEFSATEFPALARSIGVVGLLVDSMA